MPWRSSARQFRRTLAWHLAHQPFGVVAGARQYQHAELARELRSAIGYVEQDAPVLAGTLRENLVFAAPRATDDDIRDVLARTRLDTLVGRLPHGLETPVGHRGSKLSGGERQRIAIARALSGSTVPTRSWEWPSPWSAHC